jgi:hypothetical protein
MNRSLVALPSLSLAALWLCSGCSSGGAAPVSGRVTLDGQPLAGAHISFQPQGGGDSVSASSAGSGSYAVTAADGTYSLRLAQGDRPGAVVGKHRVEINMRNESDDDSDRHGKPPPLARVIPARYNLRTELTCDVPPNGKSDANFELKSK